MPVIGAILAFIGEHADLIESLYNAIKAGASKDSLKELLRQAEISASDQIVKEELGLPPA